MTKSFRVAVLGNQKTAETWYQTFGLQTFDLDVNQICSLLEKPDVENGISTIELGAQPVMTYQLMGGGRFFPMVSREEVAQVMQGVEVFIALIPNYFHFSNFMSRDFYHCLLSENLMDRCKVVIARLVHVEGSKAERRGRRNAKPMTPEDLMKMHGLETEKLKSKLYVIADPGFKIKGKSKKKQNPEETGVKGGISMLRRELMGEEVKEVVVTPVKETVTAGKALLGLGQRLTHWIGGLVRAH